MRFSGKRLLFVCVLVFLVVSGVVFYREYAYRQRMADFLENDAFPESQIFLDDVLNYTVRFPEGWSFAVGDKDSIGKIAEISSGGIPFNVLRHRLRYEVTPIMVMGNRGEKGYRVFASLSFRGITDDNFDTFVDKMYDDFILLLKSNGHTEYELLRRDMVNENLARGFVFEVKTSSGDTDVYYTQISRIMGENLVTITYGATFLDEEATKIANKILNSIRLLMK